MPQSAFVRYSTDDRSARLTLDRADRRNAFDADMLTTLLGYVQQAQADSAVRVLVIGAEGTTFCAGADLRGDGSTSPGELAAHTVGAMAQLLEVMEKCPKPIVARVQGPVVGGGMGLLAVSDVVVAAVEATFTLREVRVGAVPAVVAVPLMERLSAGALRELMLTAATIDAARAYELGLVHRVADNLDGAVATVVHELVAGAPKATAATKALLHELPSLSARDRWQRAVVLSREHFTGDEAYEGMTAFREKRPPQW